MANAPDSKLFELAPYEGSLHTNPRPVISYSRHVWLRFKANPLAMVALCLVVFLLLFTLVGPLLWPVDYARQSISSRLLGPVLSREAQVVYWQPWEQQEEQRQHTLAAADIGVVEANTEYVRLLWLPVEGADYYAVYRALKQSASLGLPLDQVKQAQLEDRLALSHKAYRYTVLAYRDSGEELKRFTLEVTPTRAISVLEAQLDSLVPLETLPEVLHGQQVTLAAHPLGTDSLGRDMLARLMQGGRISLFIGFFAPLVYVLFGAFYGAIAAYSGGRVDNILMRFADFVVALPFLLFMILFRVLFDIGAGESGIMAMLVAMMLLSWPASARLVRGQVLQLKQQAFVNAARLLGGRPMYIIYTHMLPNVAGVLLVSLTFAIPSAIFTEAFLSFIGLGVVPPTPSWGSMCNDGLRTMLSHPVELLLPAGLISITVLAFNLVGDALRDAFDIKLQAGGKVD